MEEDEQWKQLESSGKHVKHSIYLEKLLKKPKLHVGPTRERPGPILLNVAATAVKLVVKS